jgi:hypothetical protein
MLLAPFRPMPHVVEKLLMLKNGVLTRPIDIFDLFYHTIPIPPGVEENLPIGSVRYKWIGKILKSEMITSLVSGNWITCLLAKMLLIYAATAVRCRHLLFYGIKQKGLRP